MTDSGTPRHPSPGHPGSDDAGSGVPRHTSRARPGAPTRTPRRFVLGSGAGTVLRLARGVGAGPAAAAVFLLLLPFSVGDAGPNRYGHSDRVERHMLPGVSTGPLDPAWSPDGRWIAFSMRGDIWKVPAEGGEAIALTEGPAYHFEPAWSPDGTRLALTFDGAPGEPGNLDIGVVSAEGGEVERITSHPEVDVQPVWSRDGAAIYFVSARDRRFRIFRYELATGEVTEVGPGIQPDVSPDGTRLAYVAPVPGGLGSGGLWVRPLAGGEPRLVRDEETAYRMRPRWTPDGQALLYVSDEGGENEVRVVAAAGGSPVVLTADPGHELAPFPSPDGPRFAFVSNRTGPTTLHTAGIGGGPASGWRDVPITARRPRVAEGRVRVRVVGPDGAAMPARVHVEASDGRGYTPDGGFHRVISATETHYFHTPGAFEVDVPAGPVRVEALRGYDFRPASAELEVPAGGEVEVTLALERLADLPARGWFSGDTHIHDLHQGRFGLDHERFFLQLEAEDLNVTHALVHMDGTRLMGRWDDLTGAPHPVSTDTHILQYGMEFRGSLGHIALLGVSEYVLPFIGGQAGTAYAHPILDLRYVDEARAQGGLGGFVHPYFSRVAEPAGLAGSLIPVGVALGRGDFYDVAALWSDEIASTEVWFRFLNAGFRIPATGGTDNFSDVWRDPPPGSARTYVQLDGPLTVEAWMEGIRAGRTFASTGPLLFMEVAGRGPGKEIATGPGDEPLLPIRVKALSIAPMERLDVIVNGEVVHSVAAVDSLAIGFEGEVALPEGGWVAAQVVGPASRPIGDSYAFAQTSPVYVVREGRRFLDARDVGFLADGVRALRARVEGAAWPTVAEGEAFLAAVDEAIAVYEGLLAEAEGRPG